MEEKYKMNVYVCPKCKKAYPDISNSAPYKDGALCISCYTQENCKVMDMKLNDIPSFNELKRK